MTPEQLSKRFVHVDRADPGGHLPGTGLGLAGVKEIVAIHRGSLEVTSRIGEGTTVTILLPAMPGPVPAPRDTAAAAPGRRRAQPPPSCLRSTLASRNPCSLSKGTGLR